MRKVTALAHKAREPGLLHGATWLATTSAVPLLRDIAIVATGNAASGFFAPASSPSPCQCDREGAARTMQLSFRVKFLILVLVIGRVVANKFHLRLF